MTAAVKPSFNLQTVVQNFGPALILLVLLAIAANMSDVFLTERNLINVLRQVSGTGLMAVGMLFVILTRGIDLSVGSVAALGSVLSALWVQQMMPGLAVGLTMGVGRLSGWPRGC